MLQCSLFVCYHAAFALGSCVKACLLIGACAHEGTFMTWCHLFGLRKFAALAVRGVPALPLIFLDYCIFNSQNTIDEMRL